MTRTNAVALILGAFLCTGPLSADDALAAPTPACTAATIIANDSGCPATGLCTITKDFLLGDGCVFDFGTRDVHIANSGQLLVGSSMVTFHTRNFFILPGALVDARTTGIGGFFVVHATGDIQIQKATPIGKLFANGDMRGGNVVLEAAGSITIQGDLKSNSSGSGSGGSISLRAGGNIVTTSTADIDVHGGLLGCGGEIDFVAAGSVDIGKSIDITGGDGGLVNIEAGTLAIVRDTLQTTGQGDAGSGGCIDIIGGSVEINGMIQSKGTGSAIDSGGGCGGAIYIEAEFGDATVRNAVDATSGGPDGAGGCIEFFVRGDIDVQASGQIVSEGTGGDSCGGEVILDAGGDVLVNGPFKVSGGDSGGCVEIDAGRSVTVNANIEVKGAAPGSFGGGIIIEGAIDRPSPVLVTRTLDASGAACDAFGFCSLGGDVEVTGCDVTLSTLGSIKAQAPGSGGSGGSVFLASRKQLVVNGPVDATGGSVALNGSVTALRPIGIPPTVTGAVTPALIDTPRALCTGGGGDPPFCLTPCPTCGNAITEFPETCDNNNGTPLSCDGCSASCELENCNDQKPCTIDTCDPDLGCRHTSVANGTLCPDSTVCNGAETCMNGTCKAGTPLTCTDSNDCTVNSCNPLTGCQATNAPPGTPCQNGNLCTENDMCNSGGTCLPGSAVDCDDGEECTADSCNPAVGCVHDAAGPLFSPCTDDGDPCSVDICFSGACAHGDFPPAFTNNGAPCDDGDPCSVNDTCLGGVCQPGPPVVCTPLDDCHNAGVCTPGIGCSNPPKVDGMPCDDGNLCTQLDTCQAGICTGSNPIACTALDQCHGVGVCQPLTGVCSNPNLPNGTGCNDGNPCTQLDACQSGICSGSNPVVCTALDQCHDPGTCIPATGVCSDPNKPNGTGCNDGNPCTQTDTCQTGICSGSNPVVCTALDQCHDPGTCNPGTGSCSNPVKADGSGCNDGNLCTQSDSCQGGNCTGTNPVICTALDQCHVPGTCTPATGVCTNPNSANGSGCDDGNLCTLTDTCQNGVCTGADLLTCGDGAIQPECGEECDDGSTGAGDGCSAVCLVETCFVCSSEPSVCVPDIGASCDDDNLCTNDDACDAGGVCVGEDKPRTGCAHPVQLGSALLKIKDSPNPKSAQVLFKWSRGAATTTTDFGDPASGNTDYSLCVYDEAANVPALIFDATAPARSFCSSKFCWRRGNTGFKYRDSAGSRAGLQQIQLKAGPAGKAKVQAKAKGLNLTLPSLGLVQDTTVSAQIVGSNGTCFEGRFLPPANVNRTDQFKDKGE